MIRSKSVWGFVFLGCLSSCEENTPQKADATKKSAATPTERAPTGATPAEVMAASASASATAAPPPKEKPPIVCKETGDVTGDDVMMGDIRVKLKKKPDEAVKWSELSQITSLNLVKANDMKQIDPCVIPKMTGLKDLYLGSGDYDDLTPVANLAGLVTLRASINHVSDIKPLERLVRMDRLDLGRTRVRDISVISKMTELEELTIDETEVTDLTPLAACKKLARLSIKRTTITRVAPLKDLTKLRFLYVAGTAISDLNTISALTSRGLKIDTN
jgi:internalin A